MPPAHDDSAESPAPAGGLTGANAANTVPSAAVPPAGLQEVATDALSAEPAPAASPSPEWPRLFANYELLGEVARGGMGVVYKARLLGTERVVALKMVLAGDFAAPGAVERFRAEARAAANLDHPGVVPIYDIGEAGGRPYYTMPLVEGGSLQQLVARGPLPPKGAARLVRQLAEAVQYAHERGVIHRDLKPANVLLQPGRTGEGYGPGRSVPRLTDFGLARAVEGEASGLTASWQLVGTPAYMSPEQAAGKAGKVGPPSDVYGLGAILYCLVTGRPPFQAASHHETLRHVREEEPAPPQRLNPQVTPDLETVCLKCLAKEPHKRYPTAKALAEDLARFEDGRPVLARPVGRVERCWRWCRRNPALAAALAAAAASLVGGAAGAMAFAVQAGRSEGRALAGEQAALTEKGRADREADDARRARDDAKREAEEARRQRDIADRMTYLAQIGRADAELRAGAADSAGLVLDRTRWDLRGWEYGYLRRQTEGTPLILRSPGGLLTSVTWSPHGSWLATGSADGTARVWEAATGRERLTVRHGRRLGAVAWSPAGGRFATVGDGVVRVWDARTAQAALELKGASAQAIAWGPDGSRLATASLDGTVRIWDSATGRELLTVRGGPGGIQDGPAVIQTASVTWSPDGSRLAATAPDATVRVWDVGTGQELLRLRGPAGRVRRVAWSPDGSRLATTSRDPAAQLWDARTGQEVLRLRGHRDFIMALAWAPDGSQLATSSADDTVRVWDARTGQEVPGLRRHMDLVRALAYSPDGSRIATASYDGAVRVWPTRPAQEALVFPGKVGPVISASWSADLSRVAMALGDGTTRVWDTRTGQQALKLEGHGLMTAVAWSPDGARLAAGSAGGTAVVWDARTGKEALALTGHNHGVTAVVFSPDGRRLATGSLGGDGTTRVWDARTGRQELVLKTDGLNPTAWSPDGSRLATGPKIWDARTGQPALELTGHDRGGVSLCWSPDGSRLAGGAASTAARIWDAANGRQVLALQGHGGHVSALAWSHDGARIATVSRDDGTVRVWDTATGEQALALRGHSGPIFSVCWSLDGSPLATTSKDAMARLWDARTGQEAQALRGHAKKVQAVRFGKDGRWLLSRDADGEEVVWDLSTGRPRPDVPPPADTLPGPVSPDCRFEAAPVDNVIWLLPRGQPPDGHNPWAEDEVRRRAWAADWHTEDAAAAEKAGDWFATAFHLGYLLRQRPLDAALHNRRADALEKLGEPDAAALHRAAAQATACLAWPLDRLGTLTAGPQ
jgi:WD40 repeat protein